MRLTGFDEDIPSEAEHTETLCRDDLAFEFFVHVSFMTLRPYRPTFRRLSWPGQRVDRLGRLELMATHTYQTILAFLSEVVRQGAGQLLLQFYELKDSQEPIAALRPLWVLASRLAGAGSRSKALVRRPRQQGPRGAICDRDPGWGQALAGLAAEQPNDDEHEGVLSDVDAESSHADELQSSVDDGASLSDPMEEDVEGGARARHPPNFGTQTQNVLGV